MKASGATPPREMRRTVRVRSKGSIQLHRGARAIRGRVVDLATGGLCLHADIGTDLGDLVGQRVPIVLRLDASSAVPFVLRGRVLRATTTTRLVAIQLDDVPASFEACVRDEVAAARTYDAAPHVIIVDAACETRELIAHAFRTGGCQVVEVSTPWQAIDELDHGRFEPGVIAIADTVPEAIANDLRAFMRREYPEAHMVAIGTSAHNRDPAGSWISTRDPKGDVAIRVGRVITAHAGRHRARCAPDPKWRLAWK
jgi:hypothetical protein